MDREELAELHHALAQAWNVTPEGQEAADRNALFDALVERVTHLIRHDYNRFLTSMYLLDISEDRVAAAQCPDESETARHLAELILERESEKIESRRKHRQDSSMDATFSVDPPKELDKS